ncbi:hypothetical protein HNP84_004150 [Thermocatellispora tengchongensis]|uniref:FtsH ternary system domain-containing protein n=1 Tax=Thermocatellispora tengchongensis TaxID=1073253 RepID=A0A840P427_9ACTN|nr:hypothetical protein [Thermocatellispora tengchongensis]MBB5134418.1 hypothetical protein [Thermocatellispora tengchongensis]
MSATDTALRLLLWATDRSGPEPPPAGDLSDVGALAEPPPEVRQAAVGLAARTAARLRLSAPPLGDGRPVTCGVVLLAAAAGAWPGGGAAADLLGAVARSCSAYELLARHGLAEALLAAGCDPALGGALRDFSPLTALLDEPGPGGPARCELVLDELLADPEGRNLFTLAFAAPPATDGQSAWRGEVLAGLLPAEKELVLDVYETAMPQAGPAHLERVGAAARRLRPPSDLAPAAATARWWQALARLDRTEGEGLRSRYGLSGHRPGLDLYWQMFRLGVLG